MVRPFLFEPVSSEAFVQQHLEKMREWTLIRLMGNDMV